MKNKLREQEVEEVVRKIEDILIKNKLTLSSQNDTLMLTDQYGGIFRLYDVEAHREESELPRTFDSEKFYAWGTINGD